MVGASSARWRHFQPVRSGGGALPRATGSEAERNEPLITARHVHIRTRKST